MVHLKQPNQYVITQLSVNIVVSNLVLLSIWDNVLMKIHKSVLGFRKRLAVYVCEKT